jgi:hypothetical protein
VCLVLRPPFPACVAQPEGTRKNGTSPYDPRLNGTLYAINEYYNVRFDTFGRAMVSFETRKTLTAFPCSCVSGSRLPKLVSGAASVSACR